MAMGTYPQDPIESELDDKQLQEMEDRRISMMQEAGIDEKEVLHKARENLNTWNGYFNNNLTRGKDDMNFVLRDQWTSVERSEFSRLFKPAMTFNKLYDATKRIAGEQRKNKPDLIVRSLTGKAEQRQIDMRSDLVRSIAYKSQNDLVYQNAFMSALLRGFGSFQVDLDYSSSRTFNQEIIYRLVKDCSRCSWDATALKPHKGDGNYCSNAHIYSKHEFFATYPYITNPVSYPDSQSLLNFEWETRDTIVVCDYFQKEWYSFMLYKLSNGMSVSEDEWDDMQKQFAMKKALAKEAVVVGGIILDEIPKIVDRRQSQDYKIVRYHLTQNQIIDFTEWPSKYLPIIFVDGDSHFIDGMQHTKSLIHEARDAQKFINYVGSEIAAEIKNRRREQWIGTPDNIIGNEQMWRNPELQNGILIAKPDPKTGQMPTKMPPWDLSQQLMLQYQRGTMDIKEILGFMDGGSGEAQPEASGVAIQKRQLATSMSSYVFFDNLNQALEQGGRVVLDLLPTVIGDDERHMIMTKPNGKTQSVIMNKQHPNGEVENQLESGEYDIEIDTGPSFAIQRDVAIKFLQETLQANPQAFPLVADLWASNLDVQFMPQLVERFKTMVPPEILAKENGEPPPPPKPNPQEELMKAEMASKQAEIQEKQAAIQVKIQELEIKKEQNQLAQAELLLKAQKIQNDSALDVFNHQANIEEAKIRHHVDHHKNEQNFTSDIAKILADLHKDANKPIKESK